MIITVIPARWLRSTWVAWQFLGATLARAFSPQKWLVNGNLGLRPRLI